MGFQVQFRLPPNLDQSGQLEFWDAFIDHAVEANGLMCGGLCGTSWDVFITLDRRGSATDDHRRKIDSWLQDHPLVSDARIGPLVDAWYE